VDRSIDVVASGGRQHGRHHHLRPRRDGRLARAATEGNLVFDVTTLDNGFWRSLGRRTVTRARTLRSSTSSIGQGVDRASPSFAERNTAPCGVSAAEWASAVRVKDRAEHA